MHGTQRITATGAVNSMVCTNRVSTGTTGLGVSYTHTAVTGGAYREMIAPELVRTNIACFN